MNIVKLVMSGDETRQHSRLGSIQLPANDGQSDIGHRPHAESAKHDDVAVTTAHEDEVFHDWRVDGEHFLVPRLAC